MAASEELDWHLRQHQLGSCDAALRFDWPALAERNLHLIPSYEVASAGLYRAVLQRGPHVSFYRADERSPQVPDPADPNFFIEVESRISSLADDEGSFIYVSFYSEEAYLAVTPQRAAQIFAAAPGKILAQSLLRDVAQGHLRMRRHRHGIRIHEEAARHHQEMQLKLGLPTPDFPPCR